MSFLKRTTHCSNAWEGRHDTMKAMIEVFEKTREEREKNIYLCS